MVYWELMAPIQVLNVQTVSRGIYGYLVQKDSKFLQDHAP